MARNKEYKMEIGTFNSTVIVLTLAEEKVAGDIGKKGIEDSEDIRTPQQAPPTAGTSCYVIIQ